MSETQLPAGVRRATGAERGEILSYVGAQPEYNLFIIGDIENFGLDGGDCAVFVKDAPGGGYDWLVLEYMGDRVLYSHNPDYDAAEVFGFLQTRSFRVVSGKYSLLQRLYAYYPGARLSRTYLSRLDRVEPLPPRQGEEDPAAGLGFYALAPDEAELLIGLYCQLDEWAADYAGREAQAAAAKRREMERGDRTYGFFDGDRLVAAASATAGNSRSAMVVGVGTHPDYRGRGLASLAVSRLCRDLMKEGREFLCLCYNNPAAGRIYHRLGFREVGEYGMLRAEAKG